ncbi:MAG: DUF4339 domain-containing protein [Verrucomicrobiae bacterium]|nr:DUF4339 domain-containing protein [Verrucomicrobiae bacterium]
MALFTLQTRDLSQYGPVELETLRAWIREGRVLPEDQVYDHAGLKWIPASQFEAIADLFQAVMTASPAASANPLTKTHYEDPLSRMEQRVATEMQASKESAKRAPPARLEDSKPRLSRDLVRTDGAPAVPNKPPTVLERITRILISPFARRRDNGDRKKSQKVK